MSSSWIPFVLSVAAFWSTHAASTTMPPRSLGDFTPGLRATVNNVDNVNFDSLTFTDSQTSGTAQVSVDTLALDGVSPFRAGARAEAGSLGVASEGLPFRGPGDQVGASARYADMVGITSSGETGFGNLTLDFALEGTMDVVRSSSAGLFFIFEYAIPDGGLTALPTELTPTIMGSGFEELAFADELIVTPEPIFFDGFISTALLFGMVDDSSNPGLTPFDGIVTIEVPFIFGEGAFFSATLTAETNGPDFIDALGSADLVSVLVEQGGNAVQDAVVTGQVGGDLAAVAAANSSDVPLALPGAFLVAAIGALFVPRRQSPEQMPV